MSIEYSTRGAGLQTRQSSLQTLCFLGWVAKGLSGGTRFRGLQTDPYACCGKSRIEWRRTWLQVSLQAVYAAVKGCMRVYSGGVFEELRVESKVKIRRGLDVAYRAYVIRHRRAASDWDFGVVAYPSIYLLSTSRSNDDVSR